MATDKTENESEVEETEEEAPEEEATDTETEEEPEAEAEEETEEDQQLLKERLRIAEEKAERYRAERDRLKGKDKESKPEGQTPAEYDRLYLVASGYRDRAEQDEFLAASKRMGVSVEEAASDEYVLAKIERMRKARKAAGSVSRPSNGSAPVKRDVDYYVRKAEPPKDPKMYDEWEERMAAKAQGDKF